MKRVMLNSSLNEDHHRRLSLSRDIGSGIESSHPKM
jgi:hypothetical protein